jgi:Methyltransferase domain
LAPDRDDLFKASERRRVGSHADWYINEQLDFDKRLIRFRYQALKPYLQGPEGLELGPAEGEMTRLLLQDFARLIKVHALFENFKPERLFNTIVMEHILDLVEQPVVLLKRVKQWLAPGGRILVGIPNGHSIHRLVAVKMGLLSEPCELGVRNQALGQRRVYTRGTLRKDLEAAGLHVSNMGGVFFKPLTNQQIQDHWTEEMIQGFYELGKDFPEYAAELYAVCEMP